MVSFQIMCLIYVFYNKNEREHSGRGNVRSYNNVLATYIRQ